MSKIRTKKAVDEFNKKLAKVFALYEVVKDGGEPNKFKIATPFGTLLIYPHNDPDRGVLWTIFMRFDTGWKREECIKKLEGNISLNTHSGKWNIHQNEGDDAIEMFEFKMKQVGIEPKA